jgi:hypothetical protein
MPETPPKRRRLPKALSPVDMIMERNATEARKIAVLEYVATQLAECNARLASVGIAIAAPRHVANGNGHVEPPPARPVVSNPCTWCGNGPTQQYSVGGGQIQWLCRSHAIYVSASRRQEQGGIAAQAVNAMKDSTEPTYNPIQKPIISGGKIVMQPTAEDVRAAQQPANPVLEASDPEVPFEEMPDDNADPEA